MDWKKFAEKIDGKFQDNSSGFIGGDIMMKKIIKESKLGRYEIEKTIRRSYEASSHFNLEKLNCKFLFKEMDFDKIRIVRKSFIKRLGQRQEKSYNIDGEKSEIVDKILSLEELKYLLIYPKSEFFMIGNSINFRSQFIGQLDEELEKIYESLEKIISDLVKWKIQ